MCMLSFYPPGVMPRQDRIENGADVNPDGHGFAIVTADRTLLIQKSMDAEDLIDRFIRLRHIHPNGPALFHSRIATSGLVDITGCHPFTVGGDHRTVVAHNGILFTPPRLSRRSDTRIFAEDILPTRFRKLDRGKTMHALRNYCGYSNKLVILTVNPARRERAYLIGAEHGHWDGGEWHSNLDYTGWSAHAWQSRRSWWDDAETDDDARRYEPWPCDVCGAKNAVDTLTLLCSVCRSCNDCHMRAEDCMCFYGRTPPDDAEKSAEESARVFADNGFVEFDRAAPCAFNGDFCAVHLSSRSIMADQTRCIREQWRGKPLALTSASELSKIDR